MVEQRNFVAAQEPDAAGGGAGKGEAGAGPGRGERIAVSAMDESVARMQLAARWAETFAPERGDTLEAALRRFRRAFEYLDAVTHGVEPHAAEESEESRSSSRYVTVPQPVQPVPIQPPPPGPPAPTAETAE